MDNYLFKKMQVNHYTLSFQVFIFFSLVHLVIFCLQREGKPETRFLTTAVASFLLHFFLFTSSIHLTLLLLSLVRGDSSRSFFFWMTFMISPQNYLEKRIERMH